MGRPTSSVHSRELGASLRRAMERANLNGKTAAERLGWSPSRVSRLLTGNRVAQDSDVAAFLALCGVTGPERDRLLGLSTDRNASRFSTLLPKQLREYVEHESRASAITTFEALLVPSLLRTDDYARAVVSSDANIPVGQIDDWVAATAARRVMFTRADRPEFTLFLHELVLKLPVGGPAVMFDQLQHLLHMAQRPCITIHVIPTAIGAHASATGSFVLLESSQYQPMIYLDGLITGQFLVGREYVDAYRAVLSDLRETALGERKSKDLITSTAQDYAGADTPNILAVTPNQHQHQHRVVDLGRIRQAKGSLGADDDGNPARRAVIPPSILTRAEAPASRHDVVAGRTGKNSESGTEDKLENGND